MKEKLLIKILDSFSETKNIKQIKKNLVSKTGSALNLRSCSIYEFDKNKDSLLILDEYGQYLGSKDIPSEIGNTETIKIHKDIIKLLKQKQEIVYSNVNELVNKYKIVNHRDEIIEYYKKYNIKSGVIIPIEHSGEVLWVFAIDYDYEKNFTNEELNFFRLLTRQFGVVFYQAQLYEKEKKTAEREKLFINIISKIRKTLDIEETKKLIVTEIGTLFKADRCLIREFDLKIGRYLPPTPSAEFLASKDVKSLTGYCPLADASKIFQKLLAFKKMLVTDDIERSLKEYNLKGTIAETFVKEFSIKSGIVHLVLSYEDKTLGLLALHYTREKIKLSEESINFIRSVADEIAIAIHQSKLYEKGKQRLKREAVQKKFLEAIRSTLDPQKIKNSIVKTVANYFEADRCFIFEYDRVKDEYPPITAEYLSSSDVKSVLHKNIYEGAKEFVDLVKSHKNNVIKDYEKFIEENRKSLPGAVNFLEKYNIKSGYGFGIFYKNIYYGTLVVHFVKDKRYLTDEDLKFMELFVNQAGTALYQAEFYNKEQQTAERERLLREIIEKTRSTFDINVIKTGILKSICKILKAERCLIIEYDQENNIFKEVAHEHLSSLEEISLMGLNPSIVVPDIINIVKEKKEIIAFDFEQFLKENKIQDSQSAKTAREKSVKTAIALPIIYLDKLYGSFVVHCTKEPRFFSEEQLNLTRAIAAQAGIALYQAQLYEKEKQTAEREKLLRETITTVRSTLDIEKVKNSIVNSIGKAFEVNRCFIIEFDKVKKEFTTVINEYLASPDVKSLIGLTPDIEVPGLAKILSNKRSIFIEDLDKFIFENNLKGTKTESFLYDFGIWSGFAVPIYYGNQFLGVLINHYDKKYAFTSEDVEFIKTFADQTGIAIYQAKLYEKERQTAKKETLLRQIVSEIKISQSLDEAYEYILAKLADIFGLDRGVLFEIPEYTIEHPRVKYEYIRNKKNFSLKNVYLPEVYTQSFKEAIESLQPFIIDNITNYHPEDKEAQEFFAKYRIKSVIMVPLVRYNRQVRLLGIIGLCSSKLKSWGKEEIKLLQTIIGTVVNVVWDISKLTEIEEIRNTYILTLAHDLQVPVIGEKKALEFIDKKPNDRPIKEISPIVKEMLVNNLAINETLNKLIEIGNYELENKKLEYSEQKVDDLINSAYEPLKILAESKLIQFKYTEKQTIPVIKADKDEIERVFSIILENALEYTQYEGKIEVNVSINDQKQVVIAISDNGPGFSPEIKETIFRRYQMIKVLGRKIGAGLSLYLAKLIMDAHSGGIEIDSRLGEGTTVNIKLPI